MNEEELKCQYCNKPGKMYDSPWGVPATLNLCKFHLWIFDIKKECAAANEAIKLKSFPIVIREGEIFLDI